MKILITGGCGFVGSNLAISLKQKYQDSEIVCFDNLHRKGSELNVPRLKEAQIEVLIADVRNPTDFKSVSGADIVIDAAAEPSVIAGIDSNPDYLVHTNFIGTYNTLEFARKHNSLFIFLSTSRVYPIEPLEKLNYTEADSRFILSKDQSVAGVSEYGISEDFPLSGYRSLYGSTKLSSELLVEEYSKLFGLKTLINRCGVLTGPHQMGKVDQGVVVLWMAKHYWKRELSYIGYGGKGKQVRDILHVTDLFELLDIQIQNIGELNGQIFNVGGGTETSISLLELTKWCENITGNKISIKSVPENRPADIPIYITDCRKVQQLCNWTPSRNVETTMKEIYTWISGNEKELKSILDLN